MKVTTDNIIRFLPLDKPFKDYLLENFSKFNPDQRFNIEQLLWNTFEALYKLKLEEIFELAFLRAKNNQEKLDEDFYKRVRQQTDKEFENDFLNTTTDTELSSVRQKLESFLKVPN